ncbi:MAG TPA: signal peptidase II, partial [Acidimicrobiales bacterium]|nr:signal peptidase II [Acidimicrobiales bacterium]
MIPGTARRRTGIVIALALVVLAIDQVTKTLAVRDLADGPVHLVGPLSLTLGFNTGIAFSLFTGVGLPIVLLVMCLIGFVMWLSRGVPSVLGSIAIGLVVGGSLGNLSDRLFRAN